MNAPQARGPGSKRSSLGFSKHDCAPDVSRLLDLVSAFPRQSVPVFGDFVLDEFVSGEISRVSREAPVLILRHRATEYLPGGGANAVNNLADLGAQVFPIGAVGQDAAGNVLLDYFHKKSVDTSGIVRVPGWITTTKTRFLAGWTHTTDQQVLRVDREASSELPSKARAALARKLAHGVRRAGAALVSDYGLGAVTPELVRKLRVPCLTLDSRHRLLDFRGTGVTAATPNEPEIESLYHRHIGNDLRLLENLGRSTLRRLRLKALLITRGKDGMTLFEPGRAMHRIPIYGTNEAVDVTGAGDTVIAVFTLALAAGATYLEAAYLANYAGGIVVMKRRTATVTRSELEAALRSEAGVAQRAEK